MAGGPTPTNDDIARQREDEVVLLRTRERLPFREIADRIGADLKNTYTAWRRARERYAHEAAQAHSAWIGEQLSTIDAIIDGLMPKTLQGDTRSAEVLIKALERQAKLLGLDAPMKANVTVTDEMTARIKALAEELAEL